MNTRHLTLSLLFLCILALKSYSQGVVAVVDYMKVKPGKYNDYLALEKKWKPVHEALLKDGKIQGWALYERMYGGSNQSYDFFTVQIYKDMNSTMNPFPEDLFAKALPGVDIDKFGDETAACRDIVEVRVFHSTVFADVVNPGFSKILSILYLVPEPGKENEYVSLEEKVWKPLHNEAIKQKKMYSWGIWSQYPNPTNDYRYIAVDGYTDLNQTTALDYTELLKTVKLEGDLNDLFNQTMESRHDVGSDLFMLVDQVSGE